MFDTEVLTARWLKFLQSLTPRDWYDGSVWYANAYDVAERLGQGKVDPVIVAAVIAALSPQCRWERNTRLAGRMIDAYLHNRPCPIIATTARRNKAWNILTQKNPKFLNGPKESAFFLNIIGHTEPITLDGHMSFILLGFNKGKFTPNQYRLCSSVVVYGAEKFGVANAIAQAGAWGRIRKLRLNRKHSYHWWEHVG